MIDLHMHSTYSDGEFSVLELIEKLNSLNIKYASITDHNSVDAHVEYYENNYQNKFNGIMILGTEIQTIVDGYIIEVLVYNYNLYAYKAFVDETQKKFWEFHHNAYLELLKKADSMGLKYIEPSRELQNGYYCNMKFQDAIQACTEFNKNIIPLKSLTDHLYFYRYEFQNPNSIFYVDNTKAFPKLDDVLKVSHDCGGIVSLAHIDEYQSIEDKLEFLKTLVNDYNIDSIECFHPVISDENRRVYMNFANENGLLISAGSDFHGSHLPHRQGITTKATLSDTTILNKILK